MSSDNDSDLDNVIEGIIQVIFDFALLWIMHSYVFGLKLTDIFTSHRI